MRTGTVPGAIYPCCRLRGMAGTVDRSNCAADTTLRLLTAARRGEEQALEDLFARYIPSLQQWARGRLPIWARDLADTHDLVQETVLRVFKKLGEFDYRGEGALKAYLRQALMNRIRNEIRRARSQPDVGMVDSGIEDRGISPVDALIGTEAQERYEEALSRLTPAEREAIIARVELGLTYDEMVTHLGKPSRDAARMAVTRAVVRLTEEMERGARSIRE